MFTACDSPALDVISVNVTCAGATAASRGETFDANGNVIPAAPSICRNLRRDWLRPKPLLTLASWIGSRRGAAAPHFFKVVRFLVQAGENFQSLLAFLHLPEAAIKTSEHVIIRGSPRIE